MALDASRSSNRLTTPPLYNSEGLRHAEKRSWVSNRVRAARACDRCKKRKVRCSGTQPCEVCFRADTRCVYAAPYNRGRCPPIPPRGYRVPSPGHAEISRHFPSPPDYERSPDSSSMGMDDLVHQSHEPFHQNGSPRVEPEPMPPSRASLEPSQTDMQGHYVGPASGVSFLLRVQDRLHHNTSANFTFRDAPLPDFDPTFCVMISKEETQILLERFFDFTVPVDRFLHRPTMEALLDEFHGTMGAMKPCESAPAQRALLWTIFAMAEDTLSPKPGVTTREKSVRHFLSAQYQLSKERGTVRLVSVQAHLCQCLWLLSRSRVNHCWTLFGTTARLALAIGLNRTRPADRSHGYPPIELECRRRTFWSAYCLDNYLSVALGRPRIFHDDDIDQEIPSCLDDGDIHIDHIEASAGGGLSLMSAPVAYIRLSRIVSTILRDLYSIRPRTTADRCAFAAEHTKSLKAWRADLSPFLDGQSINTAMLIAIFRRQRNVLNLAYWHTILLTHRPFLMSNFAESQYASRGGGRENLHKDQIDENVKECLDAAMNIVNIVNDLIQHGMMFQAFWFTSYFAFSAILVLYVYTIRKASFQLDTFQKYFTAATQCQSQIFDIVEESSLAARYCVVLEELRREAKEQVERCQSLQASRLDGEVAVPEKDSAEVVGAPHGSTNILHPAAVATVSGSDANFDFDTNLETSLTDFPNWVQFESMTVPGFADFGVIETYATKD